MRYTKILQWSAMAALGFCGIATAGQVAVPKEISRLAPEPGQLTCAQGAECLAPGRFVSATAARISVSPGLPASDQVVITNVGDGVVRIQGFGLAAESALGRFQAVAAPCSPGARLKGRVSPEATAPEATSVLAACGSAITVR